MAETMTTTTSDPATAGTNVPGLSIVVEWENAERIGAERSLEMLRRLAAQLRETGLVGDASGSPGYEIVIVSGEPLEPALRRDIEAIDAEALTSRLRFLPSHDHGYYRQKLVGAAETSGDVILFLDSDVIPQEGWLAAMLRGLADPAVEVLIGTTVLEPADDLPKLATALFWIFEPPPPPGVGPTPATEFFVNNVAFRRPVLERHPFPASEASRGQCSRLQKELQRAGITIWRQQDAIVEHPAFGTVEELEERARRDGQDAVIVLQEAGRGRGLAMLKALKAYRNRRRRARQKFLRRVGPVGAGMERSLEAARLYRRLDRIMLSAAWEQARNPAPAGTHLHRTGDAPAE